MEYWSQEDIDTARDNGIAYSTFYRRLNEYGWDKEKSMYEPVRERGAYRRKYSKETMQAIKDNGISLNVFYYRVNQRGWTIKKASTEPMKPVGNPSNVPKEIKEELKTRGITLVCYKRRLKSGWSEHEARTTPLMSKKEAAKLAMEKRWNRERINYAN